MVLFCDWKAWLFLAGLCYFEPRSKLQQHKASSVKNLGAKSRAATDIVTIPVIYALKNVVHDHAQSSLPGCLTPLESFSKIQLGLDWTLQMRGLFVSKCWKSEASLQQSCTVYSCFLSFLNGPELLLNSIHWKHQEEKNPNMWNYSNSQTLVHWISDWEQLLTQGDYSLFRVPSNYRSDIRSSFTLRV